MEKAFDQAAVIPVKDGLVGMITSSTGKRWVVPKGQIDPGHTAREAASIEAWEEAGWLGLLDDQPIGNYTYRKDGRDRYVLVFLMAVTDEKDHWPESAFRCREWLTVGDAVARIEEPGLQEIVRGLPLGVTSRP
jgi:8-oxo-dGTP pyrophosphatase MutT (NUDIX family)